MKLVGFEKLHADLEGVEIPIQSPWSDAENPLSCNKVMRGDWLYLGSFSERNHLYIDFVSIAGLDKIARWRVDQEGRFVSQEHFSAASLGFSEKYPSYTHSNTPDALANQSRGRSNDLQIYFAIRYLLRDPTAADASMNAHRPDDGATFKPAETASDSKNIHIFVIFNHNYARNIPHLDSIYSGKFASATYVLPNIAPKSPRCISFPVGSYQFHSLIYHAIDKILGEKVANDEDWYLFTQDDVYLNRNFSQNSASDYFQFNNQLSSLYIRDVMRVNVKWNYSSNWSWNTRVLNSLENQKSTTHGNGFEGFSPLFDKEVLCSGISDIFAVRGCYLKEFALILGNYIGQNVFPEVSIPSALRNLAMITGTKIGQIDGEYLWGEDRKKIDIDYIRSFDLSKRLFLHPVKISLMKRSHDPLLP